MLACSDSARVASPPLAMNENSTAIISLWTPMFSWGVRGLNYLELLGDAAVGRQIPPGFRRAGFLRNCFICGVNPVNRIE